MKTGNYRLDLWIVEVISGTRELGLYSVAVSWTEALFYVPTALSSVLRPDQVRASGDEASRQTTTVFRSAVLLTLPLVVVFVVGAPVLCVTIFGADFRGSVDDLRLLAPGAFGIVALKLFANALTAQSKPMLGNAALAIAFATTILLDLLLIPRLDGAGAAIASTVAYSAGGLAVALIFIRVLGGRGRDLVPGPEDVRRLTPWHVLAILRGRTRGDDR
jgi:O-antigen/teichoic acid export membrane protein